MTIGGVITTLGTTSIGKEVYTALSEDVKDILKDIEHDYLKDKPAINKIIDDTKKDKL